MTHTDETQVEQVTTTERTPLISPRTRKVVGFLLLANVLVYGFFWLLLHGVVGPL